MHIGVLEVEEHPESKLTTHIKSEVFFEEALPVGQKCKFEKIYPLGTFSKINGCNVILRVMSFNSDERTEYSIKNAGKSGWKVLLEKFEVNGYVTQLHNIYKGGHDSD